MVHKLFWTGGFDSTFRLCQLVKDSCVVEPIYIVDNFRSSLNYEFDAHEKILLFLKSKNVKGTILPVRYINLQNVVFDSVIDKSFKRIEKDYPITSQYKWLSFFAKQEGYCELCHESSNFFKGAFNRLIDSKAKFQIDDYGNYKLIKNQTDEDVFNIFGNFLFPLLKITNIEMFSLLKLWGMEGVVDKIWFCYSPIDGKPCGICGPCRNKLKNHMDFLLSDESRKRGFVFNYLRGKEYKTANGELLTDLFISYCFERFNYLQLEKGHAVLNDSKANLLSMVLKLNGEYYKMFEKLLSNPPIVYNWKDVKKN